MTNVITFDPARSVAEREAAMTPPLESRGGGGNDGGMEARVSHLENTMADVRERLASIEAKVDSIDKHGAKSHEISALESRMTRWFVGTALAIGGVAFAIARFVS